MMAVHEANGVRAPPVFDRSHGTGGQEGGTRYPAAGMGVSANVQAALTAFMLRCMPQVAPGWQVAGACQGGRRMPQVAPCASGLCLDQELALAQALLPNGARPQRCLRRLIAPAVAAYAVAAPAVAAPATSSGEHAARPSSLV